MKNWSKSALSIYKYLSTMAKSIDKTVLDLGKSSHITSLHRQHNTYNQAGNLIELVDRKRKMINLKIIIEEVLAKMEKEDRRIISLVYMDGVKSETIAKILGVSIRTFFRKKLIAIQNFTLIMAEIGYNEEFFENEYFSEKWLMAVYDETSIKSGVAEDHLDKYLIKRVFKEVSRINMAFNTYLI